MRLTQLFIVLLWLTAVGGWIANLYKLVSTIPDTFGTMPVLWALRCVGVFVAPIGSVLGFF